MSDYMIINGQLYHHGIKGQKWGKRRFQNKDGSWTPAGRQRYSEAGDGQVKRSMKGNVHRALAKNYDINAKVYKKSNKALSSMNAQARNQQYKLAEKADQEAANKAKAKAEYKQAKKEARNTPEAKAIRKENAKKAVKVGVAVAGVALAAYGAHYIKSKNVEIAAKRGREQAKELFFKEQTRINNQMRNAPDHLKKMSLRMDVNNEARKAANDALNDNFAKAAKNVINYKKTGGKMSELASMSYYELEDVFETYAHKR